MFGGLHSNARLVIFAFNQVVRQPDLATEIGQLGGALFGKRGFLTKEQRNKGYILL